eukprot:PhF_6_TR42744/c0_g1_i1/m.64611/K10085/EDEM2; ER degradation enhancer, mannosidase alpha-like 2
MKLSSVFILVLILTGTYVALASYQDDKETRDEIRRMIEFSYSQYMKHAFPRDELRPVTCEGVDTFCTCALTLIDSLDTLVIVGWHHEFRKQVKWVVDNINFNIDRYVSVFEVNIRVLGGLLSAHLMYEEGIVTVDPEVDDYDGGLLRLAIDLADRLLPAFRTKTGIPYGSINLRHGVSPTETLVTSTAGGGTFILEFGVLSALTGNPTYEKAARKAHRALFYFRSKLNLVGNHINISTGRWTHEISTVGASVDSFIEYMIKGYTLFGDYEYLYMYNITRAAVQRYLKRGPWFLDAHMTSAYVAVPVYNSLSSFYAGSLSLVGDVTTAKQSVCAAHAAWRRYGAIPEGFNLWNGQASRGEYGYPLRPEIAESLYMLYQYTGDPRYQRYGKNMVHSIGVRTQTKCGYSNLVNVANETLANKMESFLLSETLKYLYLLFDDNNPINQKGYVFNTEGHPFPIRSDFQYDEYYDSDWHRLTEGMSSEHVFASASKKDLQCARTKALEFLSVEEIE